MKNKFIQLIVALLLFVLSWSPAFAAQKFWVGSTGNWSDSAHWSLTSGGSGGQPAPTSADAATCDGNSGASGTITIDVDPSVQSFTWGACSVGTIANGSHNWTVSGSSGISGTGTATRSFTCGSATFTFTYTVGITTFWNLATTTGLTLSCASATFIATGNTTFARTFSGGSQSYGSLQVGANNAGGLLTIVGNNSFGTFPVTAPNYISLPSSGTTTITTAPDWTGSSSNSNLIYLAGNNSTISIASGTMLLNWAGLRGIVGAGGATFQATNSFDLGANTNMGITPPSGGAGSSVKSLRPGIQ